MVPVMSTTSSLDGNYSPPSPSSLWVHDGESTSSVYPDRPIRPLPKRRLRSRLSPESFQTIARSQNLGLTKCGNEKDCDHSGTDTGHDVQSRYSNSGEHDYSYQFRGLDIPKEACVQGWDSPLRSPQWRKAGLLSPAMARSASFESRREGPRFSKVSTPLPAASSMVSVDGYDSFENTNNKKKRKIPISGSLSHHQSSLSADLAHMDLSSVREYEKPHVNADNGLGQYYVSGNSTLAAISHSAGMSGIGRGRLSRTPYRRYNGRSPLGLLSNGTNVLHVGRCTDVAGPSGDGDLDCFRPRDHKGVIAATVANPIDVSVVPKHGKENSSDLIYPLPRKSSSAKTQFTFTCEYGPAKSMAWSNYASPSARDAQVGALPRPTEGEAPGNVEVVSTRGGQKSPHIAEQSLRSQPHVSLETQPPKLPRKPRRSLTKQLALAARERRLQQDFENYNSPLKDDKIWVCEFCEYESIFGHPPEALVRQYEIKDRRERRRLAEKRRLLEKAKMKSKKGKKGNKKGYRGVTAQSQHHQDQKEQYDIPAQDVSAIDSQCTQSDEYILDDYDDYPDPVNETAMPRPRSQILQNAHKPQGDGL